MIRWALRGVTAGLVIGIVMGIGIVISHILHTSPGFNVNTVEVRGAVQTDMAKLKKLYAPMVGQNIFREITPEELLTDDPWVNRLEIKRVFPDKLTVVVTEEKEVLKYKRGNKCGVLTESGTEIPVVCSEVNVTIVGNPLNSEFREFIKLYKEYEIVRNSAVVLRGGYFTFTNSGTTYVCTYAADIFADNYGLYVNKISPRYKKVYQVDVTVHGKVYVKGDRNV